MTRAAVTGGGGFIAGHLIKRLLSEGYDVTTADIKPLDEWHQVFDIPSMPSFDLSDRKNAGTFLNLADADEVYHLAADMGGMGFISSHEVETIHSFDITSALLRRIDGEKFFYSSSACIYPEYRQMESTAPALKESDAYPADCDTPYGFEKLYGEQALAAYHRAGRLDPRIARFHNIMGPNGTWNGGREKAPAAICRKVAKAVRDGKSEIEIWGDGEQTRSFLYIDECVEGIRRIMDSDFTEPLNLGSDEGVSINELVTMVESIAGVTLHRVYDLTEPSGVRGRNSDNTLISKVLGWAPSASLFDGLEKTYSWVYDQVSA